MNAKSTFDEIEDAGAILAQLRELASQFESKYSFVTRITSPQDYSRATAMLDELTGGRELGPNEEALLDELTSAVADYENTSDQFAEFNSQWEKKLTPIELLKALMEAGNLKGHELPEIGDKTVVSKVLSGRRKISHKMAVELGQRFSMAPEAFLDDGTYEVEQALYKGDYIKALYLEDYIKKSAFAENTGFSILSSVSHRFQNNNIKNLEKYWHAVGGGEELYEFAKEISSTDMTQAEIVFGYSQKEGTYITLRKKGDKVFFAPFRLLKTS